MSGLFISPAAQDDLIELWVYIAQDNVNAADKVYEAAQETFHLLVKMPELGVLFRAKRACLKGIRFIPIQGYHNYIVYYRFVSRRLEIVRVLHAHMDRERRLEEEITP